jgi:hypothetical protein
MVLNCHQLGAEGGQPDIQGDQTKQKKKKGLKGSKDSKDPQTQNDLLAKTLFMIKQPEGLLLKKNMMPM